MNSHSIFFPSSFMFYYCFKCTVYEFCTFQSTNWSEHS